MATTTWSNRCAPSKKGMKRNCSVLSVSDEETSGCDPPRSDRELKSAVINRLPYKYFGKRTPSYKRQGKLPSDLNPYLIAYLNLLADDVIQSFLWVDSCTKLADKYLLAMVYVYFRRAGLSVQDYNRDSFFVALYLANDIEEEDEDEKYEIFPWALGEQWASLFPSFLRSRDQLWHAMGFRAMVSKRTCEEIIDMAPAHDIWRRTRLSHHGGAIRSYMQPATPTYGRNFPSHCTMCTRASGAAPAINTYRHVNMDRHVSSSPYINPLDILDDIDLCIQQEMVGSKDTFSKANNTDSDDAINSAQREELVFQHEQ